MKDNSARKIVDKIFQFTNLENKQVLEVGCGDGRITSLLVGIPEALIAIEPDAEKIEEARKNVSGADFRLGTGECLEFSDKFFDIVIFTLSLHHQDSNAAIVEATRVLNDEGEILVIEPALEGAVERIFTLVHDESQANLDAQQAIKKSGLNVGRSETFDAAWVFDSKEELCQSLFEYYDIPFDTHTADKIVDTLGEKAKDHPIELLDTMIIQSLKKM